MWRRVSRVIARAPAAAKLVKRIVRPSIARWQRLVLLNMLVHLFVEAMHEEEELREPVPPPKQEVPPQA